MDSPPLLIIVRASPPSIAPGPDIVCDEPEVMVTTSATTPLSKNPVSDLMLELPPENTNDPAPLNVTASLKTTCAEEVFDPTSIVPLFDNPSFMVNWLVPVTLTEPDTSTFSNVPF